MDEVEGAFLGIHVGDNTDMVDGLTAATKENKVAGHEVADALDGFALGVLLLRGALQGDAQVLEDIAGEARAVEGLGADAAAAIACTKMVLGRGDEVVSDGRGDLVGKIMGSHQGF